MNRTQIKKEISHARAELKDAYKNLKRWEKDPEKYIHNGCDAEKEWEISYASHQLGKIAILEQWERELLRRSRLGKTKEESK